MLSESQVQAQAHAILVPLAVEGLRWVNPAAVEVHGEIESRTIWLHLRRESRLVGGVDCTIQLNESIPNAFVQVA